MADIPPTTKPWYKLSRFSWNILDWIYPPRCCNCDRVGVVFCPECEGSIKLLKGNLCATCGYPLRSRKSVCQKCASEKPPFEALRSLGSHEGALRHGVHALKYRRDLDLGHFFAIRLAALVTREAWQIDLIVPVPLSPAHLKQRGYNQSACISQNLAWLLGLPHSNTSIKRVKETQEQITLDVNERFMNLCDAFNANPATLEKKRVLVVDDVITTGATMQNCAKAVRIAGAEAVYGISVGRALLHHPNIEV